MPDNQLNIIGIRGKSASNGYFFSVESEDLGILKNAEEVVKQSLWVHGFKVGFEGRYHDG